MESPGEISGRSSQVCDQCRKKKVKCNGVLPACSNCTQTKVVCTFSAQLQRKTKRRGHDPKDEAIQKLQAEVASLRRQLESQAPDYAHEEHPSIEPSSLGNDIQTTYTRPYQSNRRSERSIPGPIFRHLGRLVCPDDGVDQFAGSSTGVHFTLSAQNKYQSVFCSNENFPEAVFSLYLISPSRRLEDLNNIHTGAARSGLQSIFHLPRAHYLLQVDNFFEVWSQIYPILTRKQFYASIHQIFDKAESDQDNLDHDKLVLYQVYIILAIMAPGKTSNKTDPPLGEYSEFYYSLSLDLYHQVVATGNLASLQGLLLLLIYLQHTSQHHLIIQTIGAVVRLAHSLGLHRHARRFRFCVGETEVRKRLWWCVYIFDITIADHYGLPKIINDEDDDNDLPIDCDFDDITLNQLPLPLPGELTQTTSFICYIKLAKILSAISKDLYTTTRRRNGVQKIEQLTRELQVWALLAETVTGKPNEEQQEYNRSEGGSDNTFMAIWLNLLSQMALIYVHRPALTFEESEPQFRKSLIECSRASATIISTLHQHSSQFQLLRMLPAGPNLIFQCALLSLYKLWVEIPIETSLSPVIRKDQVARVSAVVEMAINLLDELHLGISEAEPSTYEKFQSKPPPLLQASWVLRHLSTVTLHHPTARTDSPRSVISEHAPPSHFPVSQSDVTRAIPLSSQFMSPASSDQNFTWNGGSGPLISSDALFGNGNGLDYLNQMDEGTWTFLSQLGRFSSETDGQFMQYN